MRILKSILLAIVVFCNAMVFSPVTVNADFCADLNSGFNEFLDCEEDISSFARFQGGIEAPSADGLDPSLTKAADVKTYALRITNFALGFLGISAILIVIYSGFRYVFTAVDAEGAEQAKTNIINAVIGIFIIMGSFAFVNTILSATDPDDLENTGVRGTATNRAQLANFNSAVDQVKIIRNDFAKSISLVQRSMQSVNQIIGQKPAELTTSRDNFIAYLQDIKNNLNTIGRAYGLGSATEITARQINSQVISPGILLVEQLSVDELEEYQKGLLQNSWQNAWDDFVNGFSFKDKGIQYDYICSLPLNLRPVDISVKDCGEGSKQKSRGLGSDIMTGINAKLNEDFTKALKADYQNQIIELIVKTAEIRDLFESDSLPRVQIEKLVDSSFTLKGYFNLKEGATVTGGGSIFAAYNNQDIFTTASVDKSSIQNVTLLPFEAIETVRILSELTQLLENVKFTYPVITTNVSKGSAPLVVTFDGSGSYDPADETIVDTNYIWTLPNICTLDTTVKVTQKCTFTNPGSYRIALKVNSNSKDGTILPGIAYKTIQVTAPNTKINLTATPTEGTEEIISMYDSANGLLKQENSEVIFTLNEASEIDFKMDVTDVDNLQNIVWKFSDSENVIQGVEQTNLKKKFSKRGSVRGEVTVTDNDGNVDRKIFNVKIVDTVARILASSSQVTASGKLRLDGSLSSSDLGTLKYEWKIDGDGGLELTDTQKEAEEFEIDLSKQDNPVGKYTAELTVTNNEGTSSEPAKLEFVVLPNAPAASLAANTTSKAQPNTFVLDASGSENPNGPADELRYKWSFEGLPESKFEIIDGNLDSDTTNIVKVRFKEAGDFPVKLTVFVNGFEDESAVEIRKNLGVLSPLDIELDVDNPRSAKLEMDERSILKASVNFKVKTSTCDMITFEYGDGKKDDVTVTDGVAEFTHDYKRAGKFDLRIIGRKGEDAVRAKELFVVSGGDKPVALINTLVNGNQFSSETEMPEIFRKQKVTFDASDSINIDGTNKNLRFSWETGDGKVFTQKSFDYKFRDLPPASDDGFDVKLTVSDTEDPTKVSETTSFKVKVVQALPTYEKLDVTELGGPITPFKVRLKAIGARDDDGKIETYRFYYYPLDDPNKKLGTKISNQPNETITIGTLGPEGEEAELGFCLDVKDNEGNEQTCDELFPEGAPAIVKIENGPNDLPTAKFRISRTSLTVGDSVNFIDESIDPDGKIVEWRYDLDGDNSFANDEVITTKSFEHVFTKKSPAAGFKIRSEVVDDKGGRAVSNPLTVFVDSTLQDPTAAFTFEIDSLDIITTNNSRADVENEGEIESYVWDADTNTDSDGDGVKDNDKDYTEEEPVIRLPKSGTYKIQLTVTDNQGNTDTVVNEVTVGGNLKQPTAAFNYTTDGLAIAFNNNSRADETNGGELIEYIWDFDTAYDTDGDGVKDNDVDSLLYEPQFIAPRSGIFNIKLTVLDNERNEDIVINQVTVEDPADAFNPVNAAVADIQSQRDALPDSGSSGLQTDMSATSKPILGPEDNPAAARRGAAEAPNRTETPDERFDVRNFIETTPAVNPATDAVELPGNSGTVEFNFQNLPDGIVKVLVDKNVYFDSNAGRVGTPADGVRNNDVDYETSNRTNYTTDFSSRYSPTRVKVTIIDSNGNDFSDMIDINFSGLDFSAALGFDMDENIPAVIYIVVLLILLVASSGLLRHNGQSKKL